MGVTSQSLRSSSQSLKYRGSSQSLWIVCVREIGTGSGASSGRLPTHVTLMGKTAPAYAAFERGSVSGQRA